MPIELQNPAFAQLYGQAALLTGAAHRKTIEVQLQTEKEMALFNHQIQMERMKFDSLLEFEKEKRAKTWEMEKMNMRSQIDFADDEKKRQQRLTEYDAGIKYIRETSDVPEDAKPQLEFNLTMEKLYGAGGVNYPKPEKELFTPEKRQQVLGALTTKSPVSPMGIALPVLEKKEDREAYITNELGPNWRQLLPEAIPLVEGETAATAPQMPKDMKTQFPNAFYENGAWKVIQNGIKMRIQ